MDTVFREWRDRGLVWLPEHGVGYYPVTEAPYDEAYFAKYQAMAGTPVSEDLCAARCDLVEKYIRSGVLVDVGIGAGSFIDALIARRSGLSVFGHDVNPVGVRWLEERGRLLDPWRRAVDALTFWDVLEHIHDPRQLLANAQRFVFASLPVFTGPGHVLRSKHYRRDEHCWYWTRDGFIAWMAAHGFRCVEHNTMESLIAREDIGTFVFRRT